MRYVYTVVKFVPDAERAEFVNVGVIVGSDETGEWAMRRVQDTSRAVSIGGDGAEALVADMFEFMDRELEYLREYGAEGKNEQYLDDFAVRCYRGYNQIRRPAPMVADSVQEALAWAFDTMVVDSVAAVST